jgi:hypothetical protein
MERTNKNNMNVAKKKSHRKRMAPCQDHAGQTDRAFTPVPVCAVAQTGTRNMVKRSAQLAIAVDRLADLAGPYPRSLSGF